MREMGDWDAYLIERFANDRGEAIGFLHAVMEEYERFGNVAAVLNALDTVVQSQGGVAELAKQTRLEPQILAQLLSGDAAPPLDRFAALLKALGCRLTIEPLTEAMPTPETDDARVENVA